MTPSPPRSLLIASGNRHKHDEIRRALPEGFAHLMVPSQLESTVGSAAPDPVEDGETLLENAIIKARAFSIWSGLPAMADDTGLMITALDGAPGVHTARWAGENATFEENMTKVLHQLSGVPTAQRNAEFRCVIALCDGDQVLLTVEEGCPGSITQKVEGSAGFGYDPIFVPQGETRTFAQLEAAEKDAVSHRGRALRRFSELYQQFDLTRGS
ncbi:MAG: RdgB/HAM1 family non-canonical purine NTP pyrophosphatase [Planctomycetota bacterium]|nr:RdgB/HAM1 family non-canonical purine NTP pyrophosphatase [Planctomycetota bacterium]